LRPDEELSESGCIMVGEKGILFSPNDYGGEFRLLPEAAHEGVNVTTPEHLPVNAQQDQGQKNEWVEAIKAGKPQVALSNFDYASLLTEAFLLGNVAIAAGKRLEWDGPAMRITNDDAANALIQTEYRRGWEVTRS
jgi:hypothetical protein